MTAGEFTEAEFMIAQCARLLEDQRTAFIGFGMPQVAAILAQRTHAPQLVQVFEFGAVGPTPLTPFVRNTMGGPSNCYRSIAWTSTNPSAARNFAGSPSRTSSSRSSRCLYPSGDRVVGPFQPS